MSMLSELLTDPAIESKLQEIVHLEEAYASATEEFHQKLVDNQMVALQVSMHDKATQLRSLRAELVELIKQVRET